MYCGFYQQNGKALRNVWRMAPRLAVLGLGGSGGSGGGRSIGAIVTEPTGEGESDHCLVIEIHRCPLNL